MITNLHKREDQRLVFNPGLHRSLEKWKGAPSKHKLGVLVLYIQHIQKVEPVNGWEDWSNTGAGSVKPLQKQNKVSSQPFECANHEMYKQIFTQPCIKLPYVPQQ